MSYLPYHQEQLKFMIELACSRISWLDPFFRFLNYFDTPYFFFIIVPTIWLGVSYQWGLRIFYWLIANNLINSYAKLWIGWPRPSADVPEIAFFHPSSNGFPSCGAQTCMFLGALFIYYQKSPKAWLIGGLYILLISFSRLYLAVHYPLDILGGWLIALILAFLFIKIKAPLEHFLIRKGALFSLFLSLFLPLLILFLDPRSQVIYMMGAVMGVSIGTYFSLKNHLFLTPPKSRNEAILRAVTGVILLFFVLSLWPSGSHFSKSLLSGAFISLAASPICRWLF